MNREIKEKQIMDETYLKQLEEMSFPVVKRHTVSLEEFNEAMISGIKESAGYVDLAAPYMNQLEDMEFPVVKVHVMSLEEFNEELMAGIVAEDDDDENKFARGISVKRLAMVS